MLKAVGIIAEFNPFHNGHRQLIQIAKQRAHADVVVIVMSGNWVQRGQPALIDKWARTQMALANGADLVVELPAVQAVQPADRFAKAGVQLVHALHCQTLAFGCEHPDWNFARLGHIRLQPATAFHNYQHSYADSIRQAITQQTGYHITEANDLLAFNYARALDQAAVNIHLLPVARKIKHGDKVLTVASPIVNSTWLRKYFLQGHGTYPQGMPRNCQQFLKPPYFSWQTFWPLLRYRILTSSLTELRQVYQMNEGLEHRFHQAAVQTSDFRHFIQAVKTKRYTYGRLERLCFYVLMHLKRTDYQSMQIVPALRLLGFNSQGQAYLHQIKKNLNLPLISVANQKSLHQLLPWDCRAGWLLSMYNHQAEDLFRHPVIR